MIIVKLKGGLGNQMFQYACGLALATRHSTGFALDCSYLEDKSQLGPRTSRDYELNVFGIENIITSSEMNQLFKLASKRGEQWAYKYYFQYLRDNFDDKLIHQGPNLYIEGYFQDERYFSGLEGVVREHFKFPALKSGTRYLEMIQKSQNSVGVHVRRGDSLSDFYREIFHENGKEYYRNAVGLILDRVESPNFFVFSADDPQWAVSLFEELGVAFTLVENSFDSSLAYEDIVLMKECRHNVIGVSTFSWWGAWLNQNPDKIVISPAKWFKGTEKTPAPDGWIML